MVMIYLPYSQKIPYRVGTVCIQLQCSCLVSAAKVGWKKLLLFKNTKFQDLYIFKEVGSHK